MKIRKLFIADPAKGKMIYSENDFILHWAMASDKKGIAVLTEARDDFYSKYVISLNNKNIPVIPSGFARSPSA